MRPLHEKNGLRGRKSQLAFTLVNRCINNVIAIQFYSTLFVNLGRYSTQESSPDERLLQRKMRLSFLLPNRKPATPKPFWTAIMRTIVESEMMR